MRAVLIDNRDSFTFNLVHLLHEVGAEVSVLRNTVAPGKAVALAQEQGALIVLGPGPSGPDEAGSTLAIVRLAKGRVPVLGVCLGHQAIAMEAGARIERAASIVHGKASALEHDGEGPMAGLPNPFVAGRYHSLCVRGLPGRFRVHAELDGMAMAISDRQALQVGVQFHPESTLTEGGAGLMRGVLDWAGGAKVTKVS